MTKASISIRLNGESKTVTDPSLENVLQHVTLPGQSFAVALNRQFIPRSEYSTTTLSDGDELEVLIPMQGG